MKIKDNILIGICAVAATSVATAQSTTDPVGHIRTTASGQFTFLSPNLLNTADFEGPIDNAGETGGSNFTAGALAGTHYAEILEGDDEGARADITGNTESAIMTDPAFMALLNGSDTVAVRKHLTMSDVFGGAVDDSDLQIDGGGSSGDADRVLVFDGSGFTTYYYNNFFLDPGWSPADAIISPGQGIIFEDNNGDGDEISLLGAVKTSTTIVDATAGFNLVGNPQPVDTNLTGLFGGDGTANPTDLQLAPGSSSAEADNVLLWNGESYDGHYYSNFFLPPNGWLPEDGAVGSVEAFFVDVGADTLLSLDPLN